MNLEWLFSERRRFVGLAGLIGLVLVTHAGAAVIDNFSQGPALLSPTNYWPAMVMLQTGLDPNSTMGGTRRLSAQTLDRSTLQVDPAGGFLSFEAVASYGYFAVEYGTESSLGVDLKADGSDAFLLTFSNVSMPGLWRGGYKLIVNGIEYEFLRDLAAISGKGIIRIPFSRFSTAPQFVANRISLAAIRVEPPYKLVLDSIVTVNADTPPKLNVVRFSGGDFLLLWSTNATDFVVQTAATIDATSWQTVTNAASVVEGQFWMTIGAAEASSYFRLRRE